MSATNLAYIHLEGEQQLPEVSLGHKLLTEFVGTFFLTFSIALAVDLNDPNNSTTHLCIAWTLMTVIYLGGHLSGAHYNPAVTLGMFIRHRLGRNPMKLPLPTAICYVLIQILAATVGAAIADGLTDLQPYFYNHSPYSEGKAFVAELIFTTGLVTAVLNVASTKSLEDNSFYGFTIGFYVGAAGIAIGNISGACLNPAVGTGLNLLFAFHGGTIHAFWIYWTAPLLGGVIAAVLFRLMNEREFSPERMRGEKLLNS